MASYAFTDYDNDFIQLTIDGAVTRLLKKKYIKYEVAEPNLTLYFHNAERKNSRKYSRTFDFNDVTSPAEASASDLADTLKSWSDPPAPGGTGDVVGPGSSTDDHIVTFDGATGKLLQDSGKAFSIDGTFASNSDNKIPTEKAVKTYADGLVTGLWDDRGNFNASGGAYPSSGGSGTAGAILKGDIWTISVAGTLPTAQVVEIGDTVRALQDTPGNTQANWAIAQQNIGYVPENVANKDTDGTLSANSDTKYPSQKAVKTYVDAVKSSYGEGYVIGPITHSQNEVVYRTLASVVIEAGKLAVGDLVIVEIVGKKTAGSGANTMAVYVNSSAATAGTAISNSNTATNGNTMSNQAKFIVTAAATETAWPSFANTFVGAGAVGVIALALNTAADIYINFQNQKNTGTDTFDLMLGHVRIEKLRT